MEQDKTIGSKIRSIREQRDLDVEKLSRLSGVAAEMITSIEEGLLAPSLAPLLKISRSLGVRLGTFLDDSEKKDPVIVRAGKTDKVLRFSGDTEVSSESRLDFFSLGAEKRDRHMEPFLVEVKPMEGGDRKLSTHEGEEFIFVIQGEVEVCYGRDCFTLSAGDSIYYDSVVPHYLHALGAGNARILAVLYTPS